MNTQLTKNFHIPSTSLQAIPYVILIFLVSLYDAFFVSFSGIYPLQRIGQSLFFAMFSMVAATIMEDKRRNVALNEKKNYVHLLDHSPVPNFWIIWNVIAVDLIKFFYK